MSNEKGMLVADLVINDRKATETADKFLGTLRDIDRQIGEVGKNTTLAPTISRHWENEEKLVRTATERITGLIDNAKASIRFKPSNSNSPLDFGKPDNTLFDSVNKTRLEIQKLNSVRLDTGKFDGLTKAGVRLHDQLGKTQADILRINNALKQTNSKTVIDQLNGDLVQAQNNFDKLSSRQQLYEKRAASSRASDAEKFGRIRGVGSVISELGLPIDQSLINAGLDMAELLKLSVGTAAAFGAIAAVGYGIVKVTENIRLEAERRLKVEERITGAINNQIISQREALKNLEKTRLEAQKDRLFNRSLETSSIEDLERRKATIEQVQNLNPAQIHEKPNPSFEKNSQNLLAIDASIYEKQQQAQKSADEAFSQRWVSWKKNQADAIESEKRFQTALARSAEQGFRQSLKFADDNLSAINKVLSDVKSSTKLTASDQANLIFEAEQKLKQVVGTVRSASDDFREFMNSATANGNPYVSILSDIERAAAKLEKRFESLTTEAQSAALKAAQSQNNLRLFETDLTTQLSISDLRDDAARFRNPRESSEQYGNRINDAARRHVEAGNFFQGGAFGNYGSHLANQAGGFDKLTDAQKADIYRARSFGNLDYIGNSADSTFNQLNADSLTSYLANEKLRQAKGESGDIQERLKRQFEVIDKLDPKNEAEFDVANRKIIALTQGIDPNKLTTEQQVRAAAAREHEAADQENYRKDAIKKVDRTNELLEKAIEILAGGASGDTREALIRIIDESKDAAKVTTKKPTPKDTEKKYNQNFGTFGGRKQLTSF